MPCARVPPSPARSRRTANSGDPRRSFDNSKQIIPFWCPACVTSQQCKFATNRPMATGVDMGMRPQAACLSGYPEGYNGTDRGARRAMLRNAVKRSAIAAVLAVGVAAAATPALADYYYDDGPGFALTPFGPDIAPGYGYYRGGPCLTDEGGGRYLPCDYGGGNGGQ